MNISEERKYKDGVIISGEILNEKKRIYVFDFQMKLKEKYNVLDTDETISALCFGEKKGFAAFDNGNIYSY